ASLYGRLGVCPSVEAGTVECDSHAMTGRKRGAAVRRRAPALARAGDPSRQRLGYRDGVVHLRAANQRCLRPATGRTRSDRTPREMRTSSISPEKATPLDTTNVVARGG